MSKLDREAVLQQGEQRLVQSGATPEADATAMRALAHKEPAIDAAIAARLGAQPNDASVALLNEIEARSRDKLVLKEVKRSLY
ncbi:MAG TPA: hypothetical protein VMJ74_10140, partial [Pseudomonadales bacterium]|nr:hypothetical protein [Pseudomonadales bacterium]